MNAEQRLEAIAKAGTVVSFDGNLFTSTGERTTLRSYPAMIFTRSNGSLAYFTQASMLYDLEIVSVAA
jgi:hypothetical protein